MSQSIFSQVHTAQQVLGAAGAIAAVQALFGTNDAPVDSMRKANKMMFATESAGREAGRAEVANVMNKLEASFTKYLNESKLFAARESDDSQTQEALARMQARVKAQVACAIESAVLASDAVNTLSRSGLTAHTGSGAYIGAQGLSDGFAGRRRVAREAYAESDNKQVLANTVAYNLISGIQAEAMEMLFPRVTVPSDHVGVAATIRLTQVTDDIKRSLSGKVTDFNRRNLAHGMIYPELLKNDTTRNVPQKRAENADMFAVGVNAADVVFDGVTYKDNAPLAFGKEVDIVMLSQTDSMLEKGTPDRTDSLDPDAKLSAVFIKVGTDVMKIDVSQLYLNNFIYSGQDNYMTQKLNFDNDTLVIQPDAKTIAKVAPAGALKVLADDGLVLRLHAVLNGTTNLENGKMVVYGSHLEVAAVIDTAAGVKLPDSDSRVVALKAAIGVGALLGYDQESRRSNANHSERGDLLDTTYWTQIWAVPYRAPLTALRPMDQHMQNHTETADIELLSQATYIRTTGAGIETVFQTMDLLRSIRGLEYDPKNVPNILGVARYLVKPLLLEGTIKLDGAVTSQNSHHLEKDISAVYVNRMRDLTYRLFRDTDLQAVVESGAAGTTEMPTVLVLTDPMNARYIMVSGDLRTIGPDFNMIVKTSPAIRVQNHIIMTFGYPGQSSGNAINAFHFGNMLWSPELVTTLPVTRDNRVSKELTVQPRFRHIVNLPIMGVLKVEGIEKLLGRRVAIDANILDVGGVSEVEVKGVVATKEQP